MDPRRGVVRLLVPLYEHPADRPEAWRQLLRAAPRLYGVVLNPASGPGAAPDPGFARAVDRLRAAGVRVLGYADTDYGRRPPADVLADLLRYRRWYGTDGAFLDQAAASPQALARYRELADAARQEAGIRTLALNPGVHPDPGYAELADLLVTFEGTWRSYLADRVPRWARLQPPQRLCHLVYGVPRGQGAHAAALAGRRGAGVCCAVPGTMPHPWDGLPEELVTE
ncbi:spherulation-specific family 4 protein [Streptomyces gobiensis]|uniref:spherulation-specific family 4 protein n=1 Tax=Streptomyces gobiensis TaxID=2875706 RepID=UPI001E348C98|nr:spherulation-specific family 4 protein [Streptomyces gobiensis]UGY92480.1 spherulation-specific family 4 protein [Streptomyces gobiensis]